MTTLADMSFNGILGFFGLPGHVEIIIIALVILLLFGGKKIPELARGLAKGMRFFKDEIKGIKTDIEDVDKDDNDSASNGGQAKEGQQSKDRPDRQDQQ